MAAGLEQELATDDAADAELDAADAAAAAAIQAKLTDLESQLVAANSKLAASAALEAQLAEAQKKNDRSVLRDTVGAKGLAAGVLPAALDVFLDKAERAFEIKNDTVQPKAGGPSDVDEFILKATRTSATARDASSTAVYQADRQRTEVHRPRDVRDRHGHQTAGHGRSGDF